MSDASVISASLVSSGTGFLGRERLKSENEYIFRKDLSASDDSCNGRRHPHLRTECRLEGFGAFESIPGRRLRPFEIPTDLSLYSPPFSQLRSCAGPQCGSVLSSVRSKPLNGSPRDVHFTLLAARHVHSRGLSVLNEPFNAACIRRSSVLKDAKNSTAGWGRNKSRQPNFRWAGGRTTRLSLAARLGEILFGLSKRPAYFRRAMQHRKVGVIRLDSARMISATRLAVLPIRFFIPF